MKVQKSRKGKQARDFYLYIYYFIESIQLLHFPVLPKLPSSWTSCRAMAVHIKYGKMIVSFEHEQSSHRSLTNPISFMQFLCTIYHGGSLGYRSHSPLK